jgi:hypothetical protein
MRVILFFTPIFYSLIINLFKSGDPNGNVANIYSKSNLFNYLARVHLENLKEKAQVLTEENNNLLKKNKEL